jgi:hypothetical protein
MIAVFQMNDVDIDGGRLTGRNADVGLHSGQPETTDVTGCSHRIPVAREVAEDRGSGRWAGTAGERLAAEAALERVRARLGELSRQDPSIEMLFSVPDQWSRHLFLALCRRYGCSKAGFAVLSPYPRAIICRSSPSANHQRVC